MSGKELPATEPFATIAMNTLNIITWLQAVDQGGCFAIASGPGWGVLVVVRNYYLSGACF